MIDCNKLFEVEGGICIDGKNNIICAEDLNEIIGVKRGDVCINNGKMYIYKDGWGEIIDKKEMKKFLIRWGN